MIHQPYDLGDYAVSLFDVRGFMEDLGLFVKYIFAAMDIRNCDTLLKLSADIILGLVDGISTVVVENTMKPT